MDQSDLVDIGNEMTRVHLGRRCWLTLAIPKGPDAEKFWPFGSENHEIEGDGSIIPASGIVWYKDVVIPSSRIVFANWGCTVSAWQCGELKDLVDEKFITFHSYDSNGEPGGAVLKFSQPLFLKVP